MPLSPHSLTRCVCVGATKVCAQNSSHLISYSISSQLGEILFPPRGHFAMPRSICGYYDWGGAIGIYWIEALAK